MNWALLAVSTISKKKILSKLISMPGIGRRLKRRKYDKERRKKQLPPKKQCSKNSGIKYRYYDWRADECVDVWGRYERVEVKVDGKWIPGTMTEEDCVVLLDYPKWRYAASGDQDIRKVDIDLYFSSSSGEDYDYEEVDVSSYFNLGETIQARISGKDGLGTPMRLM